jgi:aspartyl-tRNA(Asn)/glutamyl-tRNA(Gln) amidotransferase subunit A
MARQGRHAFNLTGHPALSIMCGISANGLPPGMQLVGRCFDEATVYRAAATCERAAAWKNLRPAL